MANTEVCEYCNKTEWSYKAFHTPDGHWLCNECSMKMRDLAKSAILPYDEYLQLMDRDVEIEELKKFYLDQLRLETIKAYGNGKPPESFIKEKVSEYVNREVQHTETLIKKSRLTITSEEYYQMILKLLGDRKMLDEENLSLIQAPKFLEFYNKEVNRK